MNWKPTLKLLCLSMLTIPILVGGLTGKASATNYSLDYNAIVHTTDYDYDARGYSEANSGAGQAIGATVGSYGGSAGNHHKYAFMFNQSFSLPPSNATIVNAKLNLFQPNGYNGATIQALPITIWGGNYGVLNNPGGFFGGYQNLDYSGASTVYVVPSNPTPRWLSIDIMNLFTYWKTHSYNGIAVIETGGYNSSARTGASIQLRDNNTPSTNTNIDLNWYVQPTAPSLTNATTNSINMSWSGTGNPTGSVYTLYRNGLQVYSGQATSFQDNGLTTGVGYKYDVKVQVPDGTVSPLSTSTLYTLPTTPLVTGASGSLGWSNTGGRGYVTLNWGAVPSATGYKVYMFDGYTYRGFDVGNTTSWDSRNAKTYPLESTINTYATHARTNDIFNYITGGLDLRDDPNSLYKSANQNGAYDNSHNYFFHVVAVNTSGESGWDSQGKDAYSPTLPNRTDITAPIVSSIKIGNGSPNVGSADVVLSINANDPLVTDYTGNQVSSGISQVSVSNDGTTWSNFAYPANGQLNWTLEAGPGTKKVYLKVSDIAGNWSAVSIQTVYNINDVDPPKVTSATVNFGETQTSDSTVSLEIQASDNTTMPDKLQMRISTDANNWYYFNSSNGTWVQDNNAWGSYIANTDNFPIGNTVGPVPIYIQIKDTNGNVGNGAIQIVHVSSAINPTSDSPNQSIDVGSTIANRDGLTITYNSISAKVSQSNQVKVDLSGLVNVSAVRFSTNMVDWSPYQPISGSVYSKYVTIDKQGGNTVYIQLKNKYGVESDIISKNYLVDYEAPNVEVKTVSNATATSASSIKINIKASDNVSSKNNLKYSLDSVTWFNIPLNGVVNIPVSKGVNSITVYVVDQAGNVGQSNPLTIFGL